MNNMLKYTKMLLLFVLVLGFMGHRTKRILRVGGKRYKTY